MKIISIGVELLVANTDSIHLGSGARYVFCMNQDNFLSKFTEGSFHRSLYRSFQRCIVGDIRMLSVYN